MFEKNEKLKAYFDLNDRFNKTLVFHLGIDAGYFSEYNYMVFMILYCLENNIKFKLYSSDANFGYEKGWCDYFKPFCDEVMDSFHHLYNRHPPFTSWKSAFCKLIKQKDISLICWKIKVEILILLSKLKRLSNKGVPFDYYTYDLFERIAIKNKHYSIPELGIEGDYIHAYNVIHNMIWRFNDSVSNEIDSLIINLNLPEQYVACQIRGGDKFIEYDLLSIDLYLNKIAKVSTLKDVFVLTDDYTIIQELQKKAPDYNWYTLCQKEEKGYYNAVFSQTESFVKRMKIIRFFASMKILEDSTCLVGTISATPCVTLGIRRNMNIHWVDFDHSLFFESIDFSLKEKRIVSENYLSLEKKMIT